VAIRIDIESAKTLLQSEFEQAESAYLQASPPVVDPLLREAADILFTTRTQAFREALLGCALARVIAPDIDITLPYASHGSNAFNGRTLDEQVVNPFLVSRQIPCSRGPYLAVFRRSVRFTREMREGLRDKRGYDAFLRYIDALKQADPNHSRIILRYLLYRCVELRESSRVPVVALERMSLEQIAQIVANLLSRPSGGVLPVLIAVALVNTIKRVYRLAWRIEWQPSHVADRASGVGGDITVWDGEQIYLVIEVTEREVDRAGSKLRCATRFPSSVCATIFSRSPTQNLKKTPNRWQKCYSHRGMRLASSACMIGSTITLLRLGMRAGRFF